MRPLTMMQAGWRADTQRGEFLTFKSCKGGLLSTERAYTLRVEGRGDGEHCVKAGDVIRCTGKNLWPHGDIHVVGHLGDLGLQPPAGAYTFSARVWSADTDSERSLVYITCSATVAIPIARGPERTSVSFRLPGDTAQFSLYASNSFASSYHDGIGDPASFEDIMLEFGSQRTDYEPYTATEITVPCDLCEGDVWYPALGRVERAGGAVESYPAQNLTAVAGTSVVWQSSSDLPATLETTMLVRR